MRAVHSPLTGTRLAHSRGEAGDVPAALPTTWRNTMANQSSKRGVRSDSQKRDRSRYDFDPMPATAPVEGAFGHTPEVSERSEEHTSELQSQSNLVCRLLLEKKNAAGRRRALRARRGAGAPTRR